MRLKQVIPLVVFVVIAVGVGLGLKQGFAQANRPLLAADHPKVVSGELPKVVLYSTEWCTYCKAARVYFTRKQVPFIEWDIEKNLQAEQEYRRLGGKGVPLITVNKQRIQGFDKTGFKAAYLGEVAL